MVPELDDITFIQISAERNGCVTFPNPKRTDTLCHLIKPRQISLVSLSLDAKRMPHERIAKNMVEVKMCVNQADNAQSILLDKLNELLLFSLIIAATIDDNSLLRFVPHHISVDGKHIEFKCLNV